MWPFTSTCRWYDIANAKRGIREELVNAEAARLLASSVEDAYNRAQEDYSTVYLKATASQIVTNISKGEWTASCVLDAYIARAVAAQKLTNCLTEVLFAQARKEAALLDKEFEATGKLRGLLHGVPVSVKDQYNVTGYDTTIGFTAWANKPATIDAHLVAKFRAEGAIILGKTNVPQTMLAFECTNPLWGRTLNPHNAAYTCGGSSGGEGALLAMDGAVIGLGSDVGGSLRIPAAYCGIYSLKPTVRRISQMGIASPSGGYAPIKSTLGPMARSVADLELAARVSFGLQDTAHLQPPLPYRDIVLPSKLKFGYYLSDNFVKPSPANRRAVLETVDALRRAGHECIEFDVPNAGEALELFTGITSSDGYKRLTTHIGNDPQDKGLFLVTLGPSFSSFTRKILTWIVRNILGDHIFATIFKASRVKTVYEYGGFQIEREKFNRRFYEEVWEKHGFDGLIAPTQAVPCLPHGGCTTLSPLAAATILYNIVDSPVGVIPVTHVDTLKDQITDEWVHGPGHGSQILETRVYKGKSPVYDPKKMHGLPLSVQIVGRRWEDEKVVAMMHVVDQALGKSTSAGGQRSFGPCSWKGQVPLSA